MRRMQRKVGVGQGSPIPTGVIWSYGAATAPSGWLLCDGTAYSRTTYARLFAVISTNFGSGDGSTTFNVPDLRGRTLVGAGTGTLTEDVTDANVSVANDTFTVASNDAKWITGMAVVLTTTTTLPTGLSLATTYYIIRDSATTIKFATTLANAQNGTAINLTAVAGSGTHTITHTLTARTLGTKLGEEGHAMSITEMLSHNHDLYLTPDQADTSSSPYTAEWGGTSSVFSSTTTVQAKGGNAAMNVMQPSQVTHFIIKT